jgi:hypothetical protein
MAMRAREATIKAGLKLDCVAMLSIEQLTQEALSLPSASRALLAEKLVESLEFDTAPAIQAAWTTEAKKRHLEILSGEAQPIPGEQRQLWLYSCPLDG